MSENLLPNSGGMVMLQEAKGEKEEVALKRELFRAACVADIVLDLHCDCG